MKDKPEVPVIDGIPGIMPGIGSIVPPHQECECKIPEDSDYKEYTIRRDTTPPQVQRRMMPCNKNV